MSKLTGLGVTTLSVDDAGGVARAIKNDVNSFGFSTPRGVQDTTGVDKQAMERNLLLADFTLDLTGLVNDTASTGSHAVLSSIPSTSVPRTCTLTHGGKTLAGELLFTDYSWQRAASGELTFTAPGVLADGTVPTWA